MGRLAWGTLGGCAAACPAVAGAGRCWLSICIRYDIGVCWRGQQGRRGCQAGHYGGSGGEWRVLWQ